MRYLLILLILTGCKPEFPLVITESRTINLSVPVYVYNDAFMSKQRFMVGDTIKLVKVGDTIK